MHSGTGSEQARPSGIGEKYFSDIQHWIAGIGVLTAIVTALAIPTIYAASVYLSDVDALAFKARMNAARVSKYIYSQPAMWQFHSVRLSELIELAGDTPLQQTIYASSGRLVARDGDDLPAPVLMRSAPLIVNGESVGRIEVAASARLLVVNTLMLTAASSALGLVILGFLNRLPLRMLRRTAEKLGERERELAQQNMRFDAALQNMSQGLCMFDADQRLVVCNRFYAELYGLDPSDTLSGTPLRTILERRVKAGNCPEDAEGYIEQRLREVSAGQPYSAENQLRDGRIISVRHQPMANGGWVAIHVDITEKKRAESRIAHMAHHDALTGLPNRLRLREHIETQLASVKRGDRLAVLGLDLDHFKTINDTLGHPAGDALLCVVSERLRECVRETDLVARTGGDEFSIVQFGIDQPNGASALAARLVAALDAPFDVNGHQVVIGTSIGIAIAPDDGAEPDTLLKNADLALYRAKADGRGTFRFFEPEMDASVQARRMLEFDLRRAVKGGEFELFYQPIVNIRENKVRCFEALLRWNHPTRGIMAADQFIPLAEDTGLIVPIGEWVVRQACAEAAKWPQEIRVAVNLSPIQFRSKKLIPTVISAIAAAGLAPERLEIEITETVLLQNNESSLDILHQLRKLGIRTSMDDFGIGYSSLSYLHSFPFDKIKIDHSFVRDLAGKPESIAIIRAVAGLGKSLGMATTAEGVETKEQLDLVRAVGCTEVQGFLFSKPRPAADIREFLAEFEQRRAAA